MRKTKIFKKITNGRREKNICLKKEVIKRKVGVVFWRGIVFVFWCHSKEKNRVKIFRN